MFVLSDEDDFSSVEKILSKARLDLDMFDTINTIDVGIKTNGLSYDNLNLVKKDKQKRKHKNIRTSKSDSSDLEKQIKKDKADVRVDYIDNNDDYLQDSVDYKFDVSIPNKTIKPIKAQKFQSKPSTENIEFKDYNKEFFKFLSDYDKENPVHYY